MLDMIKGLLAGFILGLIICLTTLIMLLNKIESPKVKSRKIEERRTIIAKWFTCWNDGKEIKDWTASHGIKSLVIYGMAEIGKSLRKVLMHTDISMLYFDKNKNVKDIDGDIVFHDIHDIPIADIVIITAFDPYREIKYELEKQTGIGAIYIEEILDELLGSRESL